MKKIFLSFVMMLSTLSIMAGVEAKPITIEAALENGSVVTLCVGDQYLYGKDAQNCAMGTAAEAVAESNAVIGFKLEKGDEGYLFRAVTPAGGDYALWGANPCYLNSQPNVGGVTFILGKDQDIANGAVWTFEADGSLKCVANGGYFNGTTISADPVAVTLVEIAEDIELDLTVSPSFIVDGEEGEEEYTLNDHSAVTVPGAKAIKVGFADAAASIKYATYVVNELVEDEFMGVVDIIEQEVASGTLSINSIGYAEFENPVKFYYGHKYNVSIKAWNVDADNLFDENFNMVAPIATFTCEFNGSTDENPAVVLGQPNFGDRVVEGMEIAAADWQGLTLSFPENNLETACAEALEKGTLDISGDAKLYTMDKEEPFTWHFSSNDEPVFGKMFSRYNLTPGKTYHFEIEAGALKVQDMSEVDMETWEGKLLYTNEEPITFNFYVLPELEAGKPEIALVDEVPVVSFPEGNFAEACGSKYDNGDIKFAALVRYYDAEGNEVAVDIVGAHESEFAIPTKNAAFVPELEYTAVIPAGKLIVTDFADFDFNAWKNGAEVGPQLYVSTEDLVCKFIAPDDKEYVIENTDLAADMFKSWSAADATGEATGAAGCAFEIGTSTGMPYGDGNVYYLNYADLSQYDKIVAVATEGEPRFLFNRTEDNGAVGVELPRDKETYETVVENADGSKTYTVDIKKIVAKDGFAHLHAIKGANWANTTVTEIYLVKKTEKIDTTVTLSLIADNDNEYTVNDHSIVTIDAPIKAIKATFGDLNPMEEVKYAIYDKRTPLAEGTMSVNTIGYAEFDAPVTFYEGTQYYIALTIGEELREYYVIGAVELPVLAEGDYFIKNVATGKYLNGANSWGTKASVTTHGQLMTLAKLEDGTYTIDSHIANNATSHYLASGDNTYIDAAAAGHTIEEFAEGILTIKDVNGKYLAADNDNIANFNADEVTEAAQWIFVTTEDVIASMAEASAKNPVDVTGLFGDANFGRNNQYISSWDIQPGKGGDNTNFNAEKWGGNSQEFDSHQTVALPNGIYKVSAQGYYRYNNTTDNTNDIAAATHADGTENINSYLYANEVSVPLMSIADEATVEANGGVMPFSQAEASAAFGKGLYNNELTVEVTNGELTIGVKKIAHEGCDWTVWDNFEIYYLGMPEPLVAGAITKAANDLDGMTVVITDAAGKNTITACHTVHPAGEQDAFTLALDEYNGDQYIYAKFAKVTDASVQGDNLYTIQLHNADGQFYALWGSNGYLNFQTPGQTIVFVLGLNNQYGQDGENCGLWEVNAVEGGYTVKNVGNGGYYNPCDAVPSAEPVVVKFWENATADQGAVSAPEATAIATVTTSAKPAGIYSVTGAKVAGLQKGINIVVDANGVAKKVVLK